MPGDPQSRESKIAKVTLLFWVIKLCATILGETGGDLLSKTCELGYLVSTLIFFGFFAVMVTLQLATRRYHPFLYWAVILSTLTAGTTLSDFMDRTLGLGYTLGAAILFTTLLVVLGVWWRTRWGPPRATTWRTTWSLGSRPAPSSWAGCWRWWQGSPCSRSCRGWRCSGLPSSSRARSARRWGMCWRGGPKRAGLGGGRCGRRWSCWGCAWW